MTPPLFDPAPLVPYLDEREGVLLLREIASIFAEDLPRRIRGLRDAIAASNDERARHWAHAIKGGAAIAGARQLAVLAESIERADDAQACVEARAVVDRIEQVFSESCRAIDAWVVEQSR